VILPAINAYFSLENLVALKRKEEKDREYLNVSLS